jgi:DegV family protein with EDD domain
MKIAVVTDSSASFSKDVANTSNLTILSIPLVLDGVVYNEGIDLDAAGYFELLKHTTSFPTTSQPALGEVIEAYQTIKDNGYDTVIAIHLSSGISGFVRNLQAVKDSVDGLDVHIFDSLITSAPMGSMVETALKMAEEEADVADILAKLTQMREHTDAFMIVDDLNNLVRGGRLNNGAAIIGTLLKIKPVLTFDKGNIELFEKVRTPKKAFARARQLIDEKTAGYGTDYKMYVIHSNAPEMAQEIYYHLMKENPGMSVAISEFGPVIGAHLGDKAIGFAANAI